MRRFASMITLAILSSGVVLAEKPKTPFRLFAVLEVENFENPKYQTKAPMPDEWVPLLREDVVQRVIEKHRFHQVADFEDPKAPAPAGDRVLVLRGKIVEFTHGSQAARYLVGFGAGAGKIAVQCEFVDKATGEVIYTRKVDGKVIGTFQSTEGAVSGVSKEIAKVIDGAW